MSDITFIITLFGIWLAMLLVLAIGLVFGSRNR